MIWFRQILYIFVQINHESFEIVENTHSGYLSAKRGSKSIHFWRFIQPVHTPSKTPFAAICRPPNGPKFGKQGHNHNNSWRITYPVRTPHIKCIQWSFLQIMIENTRWATFCPTIRLKSGQFGQKSYQFWQFIQSVYTQCMERIECSQYSRECSEKKQLRSFSVTRGPKCSQCSQKYRNFIFQTTCMFSVNLVTLEWHSMRYCSAKYDGQVGRPKNSQTWCVYKA